MSDSDKGLEESHDDINNNYHHALTEKSQDKPQAKGWLIVSLVAFVLAVLVHVFLVPATNKQQQRFEHLAEVASYIDKGALISNQTLQNHASSKHVSAAMAEIQNSIAPVLTAPDFLGKLANIMFANKSHNVAITRSWRQYENSVKPFLESEKASGHIKRNIDPLNKAVAQAMSDTMAFVELVAKEGRKKPSRMAKDKYLLLTSKAAQLNGLLNRFGDGVNTNLKPDADLLTTLDSQNELIISLQEGLAYIASNSNDTIRLSASVLQNQYAELGVQVASNSGQSNVSDDIRESLLALDAKGLAFSQKVKQAAKQSPTLSFIIKSASILPLLLAAIGVFALWRHFNTKIYALASKDASGSAMVAFQEPSTVSVQESSTCVKPLQGASQSLDDIGCLVDDIAEKVNILSLNAAVQTSMAGEGGRGFALVSNEVRSLAESSQAVAENIASRLAAIKSDINEAVLFIDEQTLKAPLESENRSDSPK